MLDSSYDGSINLDRARKIGRMLADIDSAINHASTAYGNHNLDGWQQSFWSSKLFDQLSVQRKRLREELRNME